MVEVPLPEIFRHVNPGLLPRREQRRMEVPEDAVGLFGDTANPYALAPGAPEPAVATPRAVPTPQARSLQPPTEMRVSTAPKKPSSPAPVARAATPRVISPPAGFSNPAATPAPDSNEPPLVLPIAQLAAQWPEPIRSEALAMNGATVALPASIVTSGLAKGKVTFSWGQIRALLNPAVDSPTEGREATELLLPLKVVAPAFLAYSRPKTPRKSFEMDPTIPALFSGGNAPPPTEAPPVEAPAEEPAPVAAEIAPAVPEVIAPSADLVQPTPAEPETEPQPEVESIASAPEVAEPAPQAEAAPVEEKVVEPPVVETPAISLVAPDVAAAPEEKVATAPEAKPARQKKTARAIDTVAPATEPAAEEAPVRRAEPVSFAPAPGTRSSQTLGEILGNPDKKDWSPPELVRATVKLEGVAGAIVALQEGLLVAAELPDHMKGDTVAAFLPQIFARLTNYAGEMQLGKVEDILFTAEGALVQIYRLGEVYLAVFGKRGEKLPWESLRLIAEELGGHHQK